MPLFPNRAAAQPTTAWDLSTLLAAADPGAERAARHLWLVRLLQWLRHRAAHHHDTGAPLLRLQHLLDRLEQQPAERARVAALLRALWQDVDAVSLFADFGFPPRSALVSELRHRIALRLLPGTPDTAELAQLFPLLFRTEDAAWLAQVDEATLARLAALLAHDDATPAAAEATAAANAGWRRAMRDALAVLVSAVRAAGLSPLLRQRMSAELLADEPFRQLARAADRLDESLQAGDPAAALRDASYLRALLASCRRAVDSVADHLAEYGVSVDIVFQLQQLHERCERAELLLNALLSPQPAPELLQLTQALLRVNSERSGLRSLLTQHSSLLARKVAERSAETGERYITRNRDEYRAMLRAAAAGGAVLAVTGFLKFGVGGLGLSPFWGGWWAGSVYASCFVFIYLMHWTVATKQPAMTAPAMAAKLSALRAAKATRSEADDHAAVEGFVDEVAHLIRSQVAGIAGNLAIAFPLALGIQLAARAAFGAPLIGAETGEHILHALTALGPTPLFAAFTGVLLFLSSLIGGWCENWFVFHRLDSAIAWHPRIVERLGPDRARRWGAWWRGHIAGLAANVSLGLMLGVVPALLAFFGLPIEVRHVTLSTAQLAIALGALGSGLLQESAFWWCALGIALTGLLNLGVSFVLAFRLALRSRGIKLTDRRSIHAALRRRLRQAPLSFLRPPKG